MAEAIARYHLDRGVLGNGADIFVASAGLQAADGVMPAAETLTALTELGINHNGRSKRLTAQMVRKADLVFCMTASQQAAVRELVGDSPETIDKIVLLDPENDIEDPIGMSQEAYDSLGRRLSKLVPRRLKDVFSKASNNRSSTEV